MHLVVAIYVLDFNLIFINCIYFYQEQNKSVTNIWLYIININIITDSNSSIGINYSNS